MAKDAPKHIWTNFGIGLGAVAAGAVGSYYIEKNYMMKHIKRQKNSLKKIVITIIGVNAKEA